MPTGLDRGTSITDSDTWRAYGAMGAPTIVIIDREGAIAYRSDVKPDDIDAFMEGIKPLAEAHGIPWPLPEGRELPSEELVEIGNRLTYAIASRELDRILGRAPQAPPTP